MNKLILFEDLLNNNTNFPDFDTYLDKYLNLILAEDVFKSVEEDESYDETGKTDESVDSDDETEETEETVIKIFSKKINIGSNSDKLNTILKKYEKTPEDEKIDYSIINKCINCLIIFKYNNKKFKILNEKINEKINGQITNIFLKI